LPRRPRAATCLVLRGRLPRLRRNNNDCACKIEASGTKPPFVDAAVSVSGLAADWCRRRVSSAAAGNALETHQLRDLKSKTAVTEL
jgi:hypothetical protein